MEGTIYNWPEEVSYGFARVTGQPEAIFIHRSQVLNGQPRKGDRVRIEHVDRTARGLRASGYVEILAEPEEVS
jgi:hypothetical protein